MKLLISNAVKRTHLVTALLIGLLVAPGAFAATTTLTFDNLPQGPLSSQYPGLSISGASVMAGNVSMPSHSGTQLAFSSDGAMTIIFNSSVGSVQTISAYVSGEAATGLFAFDANGVLLGQSLLPQDGNNILLSVTSSTVPIARVEIHDGGAPFAIDDFTYITASTVPVCEAVNLSLYNEVSAVSASLYKNLKTASLVRAALLKQVSLFDKSLKSDVSNKILLTQLAALKASVDCALKASPQKTQILNMINDLIAKTKAGQC